jgi:hypothetical protein
MLKMLEEDGRRVAPGELAVVLRRELYCWSLFAIPRAEPNERERIGIRD